MVAEVPYVEQVINEVLRIYPPAVRYINITKINILLGKPVAKKV